MLPVNPEVHYLRSRGLKEESQNAHRGHNAVTHALVRKQRRPVQHTRIVAPIGL